MMCVGLFLMEMMVIGCGFGMIFNRFLVRVVFFLSIKMFLFFLMYLFYCIMVLDFVIIVKRGNEFVKICLF